MARSYEQTHWICHDCGTCHDTRTEGDLCCNLKDKDVCKCGHHTDDHSYEPSDLSDRLDCDKCGCNNFVSCTKDDGGQE